jgi:hypothetical protein
VLTEQVILKKKLNPGKYGQLLFAKEKKTTLHPESWGNEAFYV